MKICFFCRVSDEEVFQKVQFYRSDIEILRKLGHEVIVVRRIRDLFFKNFDLYFIWWFGFGVFPTLYARAMSRPAIICGAVHTPDCGNLDDWPVFKRLLMKLSMRLADESVFISNTDYAKLGRFRPRSSIVAPCAIDLDRYKPADSTRRFRRLCVITHLTLENIRRKRLLESIDAFAQFARSNPEYEFHICGTFGSAVDEVRKKIADLGLYKSVVLCGALSDEAKVNLLQSSMVYFQPTVCEGFGLALIEAQACGLPVVTSREPCVIEINGDAVLYGDTTEEYVALLNRLTHDEAIYKEFSERALRNAKRFSVEERLMRIGNVINKVLIKSSQMR